MYVGVFSRLGKFIRTLGISVILKVIEHVGYFNVANEGAALHRGVSTEYDVIIDPFNPVAVSLFYGDVVKLIYMSPMVDLPC